MILHVSNWHGRKRRCRYYYPNVNPSEEEPELSKQPTFVENNLEILSKTVLLVDDNVDTRLLTKMFLNHFGFEVDSVDSANEALKRFDPLVHDLVLTDNSMPGMTGAEMARVIRHRSQSTPILMCTGNPPHDISGIDMVISKPTHLLAIKDAIDKLLAGK
jgi:CheY-like chemotaxis protein